jgi:superfamily II DNA or RNA helicase
MLLHNEAQYQPQSLRPYQREAVDAILAAWADGEPGPLAALATGGGKTTVASQLLRETIDPRVQRALVFAHTEEIIGQFYERIRNQFNGELDGYFGEYYAPGLGLVQGQKNNASARIVVGTRQSLHPKRLREVLKHGLIDIVIIDEAHHATGENTYGEIIDTLRKANPSMRIVGLTATPARGDDTALGSIFTKIVFQWLIPDGVAQGYLVPVTRIRVATQVRLDSVKTTAGDYAQNKLVSVLKTANWLELSVKSYMDYVAPTGRQCLAFLPSVEMSEAFAAALRKKGVAAAHLDGDSDKDRVRRPTLRDYSAGKLRCISNMGVLIEGFDAPSTSAVFFARPTQSRTLFTQAVGRGVRLFPGKTDCLLVDMTVNDTRALEVGSLLGRMIVCPKCRTEHYAGMKACPQCGYARTWQERAKAGDSVAVEDPQGGRLLASYENLFDKAFAAWYMAEDGFISCNLSYEDGAFIIVPPLEDNYYRLAYVPKERSQPVSYKVRNEDLASLMLDADAVVRAKAGNAANKDASWREHPATPAQLQMLKKLGAAPLKNPTKGAASQLITHTLAVKRLIESGT